MYGYVDIINSKSKTYVSLLVIFDGLKAKLKIIHTLLKKNLKILLIYLALIIVLTFTLLTDLYISHAYDDYIHRFSDVVDTSISMGDTVRVKTHGNWRTMGISEFNDSNIHPYWYLEIMLYLICNKFDICSVVFDSCHVECTDNKYHTDVICGIKSILAEKNFTLTQCGKTCTHFWVINAYVFSLFIIFIFIWREIVVNKVHSTTGYGVLKESFTIGTTIFGIKWAYFILAYVINILSFLRPILSILYYIISTLFCFFSIATEVFRELTVYLVKWLFKILSYETLAILLPYIKSYDMFLPTEIASHMVYINIAHIYLPIVKLCLIYIGVKRMLLFIHNKGFLHMRIFENKYFMSNIQWINKIVLILGILIKSNYVLYIWYIKTDNFDIIILFNITIFVIETINALIILLILWSKYK
jgi:hypothetical protein